MFFTPFDCFSRKGALFLLFFKLQKSKKSVAFRGLFTPFDCFSRKGKIFSLFFKFQIGLSRCASCMLPFCFGSMAGGDLILTQTLMYQELFIYVDIFFYIIQFLMDA